MMKYIYLTLLSASAAVGQTSDNFSDGNFTENPIWTGIQSHFEVDNSYRLHLNAPSETSASSLRLNSTILENAVWEMSLKMDFNPSSSNYVDWYIKANDTLLENSSEAYFVRIGNTEDEVSLYRLDNGIITKIIDGLDDRVNMNTVDIKLKVERSLGGNFSLWVDLLNGFGWTLEGVVEDTHLNTAIYSGVYCKYTSTRSDKFYFDDFLIDGTPFVDSIAPILHSIEVIGIDKIILLFEEPDFGELNLSQFEIIPQNILATELFHQESEIHLAFQNTIPVNQNIQLNINSLSDSTGNLMNDTLINFYVQNHFPFDVLINELMIDPEPTVQLPNTEYIELYNRADYPINIKNWKLIIDGYESILDSIVITSNAFLILVDEDDSLAFEGFNFQTLPLARLNNTEGYIGLFDTDNKLIHEIYYHKQWYQNPNKENGGWSIEMMDVNNYCSGKNNWKSCANNLGGSPGFENSIQQENADTLPPIINEVLVVQDNEIEISWSENLYDSTLYFFNSYVFSNGLNPKSIIHFIDKTHINFFSDFDEGFIYKIQLDSIEDCQGNLSHLESEFIKGVWPEEGMIVINEILFNPIADGHDFIELYNISDKYIDLSELIIGNYDSLINDIVNTEIITNKPINFPPYSYLVLCEDTAWLKDNYDLEETYFLVEVDRLPSLPNEKGSAAISSISYEIIDIVHYNED